MKCNMHVCDLVVYHSKGGNKKYLMLVVGVNDFLKIDEFHSNDFEEGIIKLWQDLSVISNSLRIPKK